MNDVFLYTGVCISMFMLMPAFRSIKGPTVLDRLVGVNAIGSKTIVLLIVIGLLYERVDMFVDIALAYAMLNFIAVLAASRYFQKRKGLYQDVSAAGRGTSPSHRKEP
ncbi:MAG: pH regulation protein F [Desulfobacteraceae bacterium]|nr:MAG: pH regulation protein F [Desulfobacteraceae bacterium]